MVQILAAKGYDVGYGKMDVDVALYNTDSYSLVVAVEFFSTDATPKYLGKTLVACVPVASSSGCWMGRITGLTFSDPFRAQVKRCISTPNCGSQSCSTFSTVIDSSISGDVAFGVAEPSVAFGGVAPTGCVSCTANWQCEQPSNGYEYDSCSKQRRMNPTCNPSSGKANSQISLNSSKSSPFNKGDNIRFGGILESANFPYCDIPSSASSCNNTAPGAINVTISVGGTTLVNQNIYSFAQSTPTANNYLYDWVVPSSSGGTSLGGMDVKVVVTFAGNGSYNPSYVTQTYKIAPDPASACGITMNAPSSILYVGDKVVFSGQVQCMGVGVAGKTVEIHDSLGLDDILATSVTTTNGMFSASWIVQDINYYPNAGRISVYAKDVGTGNKSTEHTSTISSTPTENLKYSCRLGNCIETVYGQYNTLDECQSSCGTPTDKYSCVSGACKKDNANGTMTLDQCTSTCTSGGGAGCPSGYAKDMMGQCQKSIDTPFGTFTQSDLIAGGLAGIATVASLLFVSKMTGGK